MRKLIAVSLLVVIAAVAAAGVATGAKPLIKPEKVKVDFLSNPRGPSVVESRAVSPVEARSMSLENGNTAETLEEVAPAPLAGDATAAAGERCWYVELKVGMGTLGYERDHHAATTWCAIYGSHITYSRTNTRGSTSGFCTTTGTGSWVMGGGPGYSWVKKHTWSSFSCATPWWFPLNDTLWMNIAYNSWGNYGVPEHYP